MSSLTPERLNELEQLARAAETPTWMGLDDCPCDETWAHHRPNDAQFVAAFDPATVLALLSEVRALRESVLEAETQRDHWRDGIASRELRLRAMASKWRADANECYRGSPSSQVFARALANELESLLDWENSIVKQRKDGRGRATE